MSRQEPGQQACSVCARAAPHGERAPSPSGPRPYSAVIREADGTASRGPAGPRQTPLVLVQTQTGPRAPARRHAAGTAALSGAHPTHAGRDHHAVSSLPPCVYLLMSHRAPAGGQACPRLEGWHPRGGRGGVSAGQARGRCGTSVPTSERPAREVPPRLAQHQPHGASQGPPEDRPTVPAASHVPCPL